ncbi:MAG: hypothetical protein E7302_07790 [Butyrivibrio sp.]|nr:hypothetical protein [Butyrivibrio sp.]
MKYDLYLENTKIKKYNARKAIGKAGEKKKYFVKKLKKGDTVYIKIESGNTTGLYGLTIHDATIPLGY